MREAVKPRDTELVITGGVGRHVPRGEMPQAEHVVKERAQRRFTRSEREGFSGDSLAGTGSGWAENSEEPERCAITRQCEK